MSEDANISTEPAREAKLPTIIISKLNDLSSLPQLLNQIANNEFDLKNINTGNFKIQIKCSIAYINIVKELKTRNFKFHTYKPQQEKSFKIVLKHMPPEEKIDEAKRDIEELGHKVTDIWNIKERGTLNMLNCITVKPEKNNKDIYQTTRLYN